MPLITENNPRTFGVCLWLMLCIFFQNAVGQNMVLNGGFEVFRGEPPCGYVNDLGKFTLSNWFVPTRTTPDIFSTFSDETCLNRAATSEGTKTIPRSGQTMIGLFTYGRSAGQGEWREYVQTELIMSMIPGRKYVMEMWVCLSPNSYMASVPPAMLLSQDRILRKDFSMVVSQAHLVYEGAMSERGRWVMLRDTIVAEQSYRWLTIGNFQRDGASHGMSLSEPSVLNTDLLYGLKQRAYFFVDDVRIVPLDEMQARFLKEEEEAFNTMTQVHFEHDRYDLNDEMRTRLNNLMLYLKRQPFSRIMLYGHTDSIGEEDYNISLSERRTQEVIRFLIQQGVSPNRIEPYWFGPFKPAADNSTPEGRYLNRRVNIELIR
jgi:OOP family OmpA-OmpF porin